MEQAGHTFAAAQQKNRRKKRIRTLAVLAAAVVVLAIAAAVLVPLLTAGDAVTSVLTWQVAALSEGEISTSVSGSGTLTALSAATFTAPADAVVEEVLYRAGDHVSAGDTRCSPASTGGYTMSVSVDELDIGGIGIASSALGLSIFSAIAGTAIAIEWRAAIAAVLFSVAIGVLFGSCPAAKASRMSPIDALQRR